MSVNIRSYENADAKACCKIWNDHYANIGLPSNLDVHLWEFAIVGKIFFDEDLFLVAVENDSIIGFVHATLRSDEFNAAPTCAIINAICVKVRDDCNEIAAKLITTLLAKPKMKGIASIAALGSPSHFSEYTLISPLYGMLGVPASDQRVQRWLLSAGFRAASPIDLWEVSLANLRPPMDRGQMAVRRNSDVGRVLNDECDSWFLANAFGHAEQLRFTLSTRGDERIAQEVTFFYLEQSPMRANMMAQLFLEAVPADPLGIDQITFLLAESLRQLQYERFSGVIALTQANDLPAVSLLQRLSFRTVGSGVSYQMPLK